MADEHSKRPERNQDNGSPNHWGDQQGAEARRARSKDADEQEVDGDAGNDDDDDEELETLRTQFRQLEEDFKEIDRELAEGRDRRRQHLGGDRLVTLLKSPAETLRCLDDPNEKIRELAIDLATRHWDIARDIAERCEQMAISDPSISVRSEAIIALGKAYRRQPHVRITTMLARLVSHEALSTEERKSAYGALAKIDGRFDAHTVSDVIFEAFPSLVDWDFVRGYLNPHD